MSLDEAYRIVRLESGAFSVRSVAHGETFHPVIGPVAEAEALYLRQLRLPERLARHTGEFVIWDVGLGAAANVLTTLRGLGEVAPKTLRIVSFDQTLEPLRFALENRHTLDYLLGFEAPIEELLSKQQVTFKTTAHEVHWQVHVADFPPLLASASADSWPKPDAIFFDAYSPARNTAMWTYPLFERLYQLLDPARPCALPTYSRSTLLRVTLLLAGFYVGSGHATGKKEETTIAANSLSLIDEPLPREWLKRVRMSTSAEPLWIPEYRQAPLSSSTWAKLLEHPQWNTK